jgi:hypothetical protein
MKIDTDSLWHISKTDIILNLYLDWTTLTDADFFRDNYDIFLPSLMKQFKTSPLTKKRERLLLSVFAGLNFSLLSLKKVIILPTNEVVIQKLHFLLMGLLSFAASKLHHTLAYEMTVKDNQIYSDIGNSAKLLSQILLESALVMIHFHSKRAHESFRTILAAWAHSFDITNAASLVILDDFITNLSNLFSDIRNYSPDQLKVSFCILCKVVCQLLSDRSIFLRISSNLENPPARIKSLCNHQLYSMRIAKECILVCSIHYGCFSLAIASLNDLKEKLVNQQDASKDQWSNNFTDFLDIMIDLFIRNINSDEKRFKLLEIDTLLTCQILKFVDQKNDFSKLLKNILFPLVENICIYPANRAECMNMVIELVNSMFIFN